MCNLLLKPLLSSLSSPIVLIIIIISIVIIIIVVVVTIIPCSQRFWNQRCCRGIGSKESFILVETFQIAFHKNLPVVLERYCHHNQHPLHSHIFDCVLPPANCKYRLIIIIIIITILGGLRLKIFALELDLICISNR